MMTELRALRVMTELRVMWAPALLPALRVRVSQPPTA
jgi:hypothetical protein